MSLARRVAGFGLSVVVPALVGLFVIPAVTSTNGSVAWGNIALSQTVGTLGSILVAFGWGVTGPSDVARAPTKALVWFASLPARLFLSVAAVPAVVGATAALIPGASIEYLVSAAAFALAGLSSSWYFVGAGRPMQLLLLDTLPRVVGTAAGIGLMLFSGSLLLFVIAQLVGYVVAPVLATTALARELRGSSFGLDWSPAASLQLLRTQTSGFATAATAALYANSPMVVVSIVAPGGLATYATADKIIRYALSAMRPITQVAQGAIPHADVGETRRRALRVTTYVALITLPMGVIGGALIPFAARVLSAGTVSVDLWMAGAFAATFAAITVGQIAGVAGLLSLGRAKALFASTLAGALVGFPLQWALGAVSGSTGVAAAVALGELLVCGLQVTLLASTVRPKGNC